MNNEELKRLSEDVNALYQAGRDWKDVMYFHRLQLAAAAIPGQTIFFNVGKAIGICNLDKPSQVSYPTIITEIAIEYFGTTVDVGNIFATCDLQLVKDHRGFCPIPLPVIPSGSGINGVVSGPAAVALIDSNSNGLDGRYYELPLPVAYVPNQILSVILRSTGIPVMIGTPWVAIGLKGLVSRSML